MLSYEQYSYIFEKDIFELQTVKFLDIFSLRKSKIIFSLDDIFSKRDIFQNLVVSNAYVRNCKDPVSDVLVKFALR
jgi:hypothetical protein